MLLNSLITKPIIIIGCNRSGTTLLFRNLSSHPDLWSLYLESQRIFYKYYPIHSIHGDQINADPPGEIINGIRRDFYRESHNKEKFKNTLLLKHLPIKVLQKPIGEFYKSSPIRIVEKTPANCFRIPFLCKVFPDAKFIFLIRRAEDAISSLMEGWKRWSNIQNNEDWTFTKWHYLVPPDWQKWKNKPLEQICAFQWLASNKKAWKDLNTYCKNNFYLARHEDLLLNAHDEYQKILDYCELQPSKYFKAIINRINSRIFTAGGSKPRQNKWKHLHYEEINSVKPICEPFLQKFYSD